MSRGRERRWQAIKHKLLAHAGELRHQGSVVRKTIAGRQYSYVRFYSRRANGMKVQHSIYVGADPEFIRRVREILDHLREAQRELERILELTHALSRFVGRIRYRMEPPDFLKAALMEELMYAPCNPSARSLTGR